MDDPAHVLHRCFGQRFQRGIGGKQFRCYLVYPGVGTLGGQTRGKQQFVVFLVGQRTDGVWVKYLQILDNTQDCAFSFHGVGILSSVFFVSAYYKFRQNARGKADAKRKKVCYNTFQKQWSGWRDGSSTFPKKTPSAKAQRQGLLILQFPGETSGTLQECEEGRRVAWNVLWPMKSGRRVWMKW